MPDRKSTSVRPAADENAAVRWEQADPATLRLHVSGRWKIDRTIPAADEALQQTQSHPGVTCIAVDAQQVSAWDSTLITFLLKLQTHCSSRS
jgi:ABC-type transporter Mla MlaB component